MSTDICFYPSPLPFEKVGNGSYRRILFARVLELTNYACDFLCSLKYESCLHQNVNLMKILIFHAFVFFHLVYSSIIDFMICCLHFSCFVPRFLDVAKLYYGYHSTFCTFSK